MHVVAKGTFLNSLRKNCSAEKKHSVLAELKILLLFLQGYGNKGITLYDIRAELSCRYKDLRVPYRVPNTEEVFNLLTKETPETFYIGNRNCTTLRLCFFKVSLSKSE